MLRRTLVSILLLVIAGHARALTEARLLNKSSTGQTVVFNLGSQDGIKEGDYAVIVRQVKPLESRDLKFQPVGKARNIKINSDSSVWILYKVFNKDLLILGAKYNVLSESHVMSGRKEPELGRLTVVSPPDELEDLAIEAESSDQDRLGKLKDDYEVLTPAHEKPIVSDKDAEVIDLEEWKTNKNSRYRSSIYKSANKAEFRRQLRLATFEKVVTAYLEKVNDPNFNYEQFYERQRKDIHAHEFSAHGDPQGEYNKFLRAESKKASADAKLYRTILEKGENWSVDYSDEELRTTLTQVSILQEKDRRIFAQVKPMRYATTLDYSFQLTDSQTDRDLNYQRNSRFATELEFEAVPFLRHETLERFSLTTSFRLNYSAFEVEDVNADLNEYSLSLGANWYPLYKSYSIGAPIFFVGTYLRSGFAKVVAPSINEKGNYTVLAMPGFRAGFKYLLKNRIGMRVVLNMETLQIERYESNSFTSNLPENTNLVEAKLGIGLTYAY